MSVGRLALSVRDVVEQEDNNGIMYEVHHSPLKSALLFCAL